MSRQRLAARATRAALSSLATVTTSAGALPAAYLAVVTAAGVRRPKPEPVADGAATRFVVVVPAHDEAAGIAPTLASFDALDYPRDRFDVHVVADNCTDATAEVVRAHGWHAHERTAPDDPGKGAALNWLHDRLVDRDVEFDAIAVVDADTTLDPGFLRAMDRAVRKGASAAQGYYSVRDAGASASQSFRFAALACRHHLRPLGRNRLGASCGLYGNGMVFTRELIGARRWSGHLVEDAEFQMELLLDGIPVRYVPDARLSAEMPTGLDAATSQNERWERGRIELARRYVPTLTRRALTERRRRVAFVDAAADHLVPPISVLAAIQVVALALVGSARLAGARSAPRLAVIAAASAAVTPAHVLAGLWSVDARREHYRALSAAPRIALWKMQLWVRTLLGGDEVTWTRTARNEERLR